MQYFVKRGETSGIQAVGLTGGDSPADAAPPLLPRGSSAPAPEVVARVHRQRLLRAMGQAVAENGYVATTIADIVARARVSRSAFYACFADKETCFLAGYAEEAERHFQLIAAGAQQSDWWQQLSSAAGAYVAELEAQPAFARSFLVEILAAGPRALALRESVHQRYAALMQAWYESAPPELALPPLPAEVFRGAVGTINELAMARLQRRRDTAPSREPHHPLEKLVVYSLLALFGLADPARAALGATAARRDDAGVTGLDGGETPDLRR